MRPGRQVQCIDRYINAPTTSKYAIRFVFLRQRTCNLVLHLERPQHHPRNYRGHQQNPQTVQSIRNIFHFTYRLFKLIIYDLV